MSTGGEHERHGPTGRREKGAGIQHGYGACQGARNQPICGVGMAKWRQDARHRAMRRAGRIHRAATRPGARYRRGSAGDQPRGKGRVAEAGRISSTGAMRNRNFRRDARKGLRRKRFGNRARIAERLNAYYVKALSGELGLVVVGSLNKCRIHGNFSRRFNCTCTAPARAC